MKRKVLLEGILFSSSAILGPILILGGLGYVLDDYFGTNKLFIFIGIGIAFAVTQVLMFKKVKEFSNETSLLTSQSDKPGSDSTQETN